ncbi:7382_t:CDS:2 [Funneliformis geosporum]|uniref:7382_t:CDS:1 n=1 Tax=Funneliformis geosporum TaxID=1117311 RepID=A0A9W4WZR1_9GLOM|nr:7382_t:CDS:2 [Funneliformis geosporum]
MNTDQRIELLPYEKYERIKLPYELNELEKFEEESATEKQFPTLIKLMENLEQLPEEIKKNVRFFGGGLINHNFFFAHLTKFKVQPTDYQAEKRINHDLLNLIQEKFVNLETLKRELVKSALQVQGSG